MELLLTVLSGFALAPAAPWLSRVLGRMAGWALALLPLLIAVLLWTMGGRLSDSGGAIREAHEWVPGLGVAMSLRLDGLSLLMGMLISGIGAAVFVYAGGYLAGHPHRGRLFAFLLMFMGSMLGVVLADNLIVLFVFWELTGLSSYLLIGFDHRREKARKAALQALLVTGLGGLALLAGALVLGGIAGTLEISELYERSAVIRDHPYYGAVVVLLVLGAFTKSAQFPFHFWLPGAMEAPTPVSAYLHSSTMVKAGVYLLARFAPILGGTVLWTDLLTWFGAATMLVGAWLAFRQTYMKPLLAYSTVAALGSIVMLLGIGTPAAIKAAMVVILSHAFYKGALFMAAGAIDHATGEKDLSRLGGLAGAMPLLFIATLIASLSWAGLPPLAGFIAKELGLKAILPMAESGPGGMAVVGIMAVSAALSAAVAFRMGLGPFFGARKATPDAPHEPPPSLLLGPVVLSGLSIAAALAPGTVALPLVAPAAGAVVGAEAIPDMALWHGVNAALILSAAAIGVGALLFALQRPLIRLTRAVGAPLDAVGPERWYDLILGGVLAFARLQTRLLQSGYLRQYLFVTIGATVLAVGAAMVRQEDFGRLPVIEDVRSYEAGLVLLILVAAGFTAVARSRLAAIASLGLVGYGIALVFVLFGAPDLALTQVSIETLSVVLLVLVFYMLPDFRSFSRPRQRARDAAVALACGALMTCLVLFTVLPRSHRDVSAYYSAHAAPEAYGRNVVNVILVDFRALDTLGEITVLVIAAVGVYALMKVTPQMDEQAGSREGKSR